jgi:caa(3)-type oxidase subunit IV
MADSIEAIKKSTRTYMMVFIALCIGTVVTVLVATVEALDVGGHGFDMADMILGLIIATVKASLVAIIFMHLNHEKKAIYWIFGGGLLFAGFMAFLIALAKWDPIYDPHFFNDPRPGLEAAPEETPPPTGETASQ